MELSNDWIVHLTELRRRLLYCLITIGVIGIPLIYFANSIYHLFALPLLNNLPVGGHLVATAVAGPVFVPLKLAIALAMVIAIPVVLYHLWSFIVPGLYHQERALVWPLLIISILLFYFGLTFAYLVVFPLLFHFLTHSAPEGVTIMTDIDAYLSFALKLLFAFGVIFEIPVIIIFCVRIGLFSIAQLIKARPYVIVAAFILGMFLAPPDVLSQTLLALPIWWLYEIGLLAARLILNNKNDSKISLE